MSTASNNTTSDTTTNTSSNIQVTNLPTIKPKLWYAWYCPYAQRAWIAIEEKGIEYDKYDCPFLYIKASVKDPNPNKPPEFLRISPNGLVPALELEPDNKNSDNPRSVYESLVVVDYLDEAYPNSGQKLYPSDVYLRAHCRIWINFIDNKIVSLFYKLLMNQDTEAQNNFKQQLETNILTFTNAMSKFSTSGYFLGSQFSAVDIALIPWAFRFNNVIKHYRNWTVPSDDKYKRYHDWYNNCIKRPSFVATIQDEKRLIDSYIGYANGTATSTIAKQYKD